MSSEKMLRTAGFMIYDDVDVTKKPGGFVFMAQPICLVRCWQVKPHCQRRRLL